MVVPLVEIARTTITILHQIVALAQTAKSYRRKCRLLEGRVYMIIHLLEELHKSPWMPDSATEIMLNELRDTTDRALALVKSCQRKKVWNFFKSYKMAAEFDALQEQISYIMQHFHIANRILMLNLNIQQQFFMTVLDKLLLGGACQRLPQSVEKDLKSYIRGLKNCDHMSPDAKRLLEIIVSDLNCRSAARRSRATSDPSGGEDIDTSAAGVTGGSLVRDVVSIANDILEAVRTVKLKKEDEFPLKKEDEVRQVKLKKEEKVRQVKLKKEDEVPLKKEDEVRQVKLKKEDKVRRVKLKKEDEVLLKKEVEVRQVKLKKEDKVRRVKLKKEDKVRRVKLKKEDEVRQLARYAEQAIDLLQQLHASSSLTRDTVKILRDALRDGRDIVRWYIQQHTRRGVQVVPRCGGEGPVGSYSDEISSVLYRIKYYLQIIPIIACSPVHQTMHKKRR